MKQTIISVLAGILIAGCNEELVKKEERKDERLPRAANNQSLLIHPRYLSGITSLGYTLLTDIDRDGKWDVAEEYKSGFTTGDGANSLYFKKGYGPAQGIHKKIEFVDENFFKPYE